MTYEQELNTILEKIEGLNDYTWDELVDLLEYPYTSDALRKSLAGKYGGCAVYNYLKDKMTNEYSSDEEINKLEQLKDEIYKERQKLIRINREKNEILKVSSDKELFDELIKNSIENLAPIQIKNTVYHKDVGSETTGVLCVADAHYGKTFQLNGLFNEVINKYSPEIFKARMWKLLSDLENDMFDIKIDKLKIIDTGDCIDGILRTGTSLRKLQVGVTDSVLQYSEFMATWICECYNRLQIPVEYSLTGGNHDMLRLLTSKKDFDDENVAKFINEFITLRIENSKLKNNQMNAQISIKSYNDAIYHNIYGMNIMSYHGDSKDMKDDIDFFENYYNIQVDMLIAGHLHRNSNETIGVGDLGDREIIRVPSICGTDDFAKKIKKHSRAGAKFMTFDKNGKNWEKIYYLN